MRIRFSFQLLVAGILIVAARPSLGEVTVGDKPTLQFTAVDGSTVDLQQMRGKMVVISFWSVSDAGRLQQRRMVELFHEHADDGVAFIGICCDRELVRCQAMVQEIGMHWPQYWDGKMWNGRINQEWGCTHLSSVLVGPDGKVLWTGSPLLLDKRLADALVAFPPTMVDPDVLAKANATLDDVERSLKDPAGATAALMTFAQVPPDASKNKPFAQRVEKLMPALGEAVEQILSPVDDLLSQHRNLDAMNRLNDLARDLKATLAERDIAARLSKLKADPETQAQLAKAQREQKAQDALTAARRLRDDQHHATAYQALKAVITNFSNTPAAAAAAELVQTYELDPQMMDKIHREIADAKVDSMLSIARNYAASKMYDQARAKYQTIIQQFPNTPQAAAAKRESDALAAH